MWETFAWNAESVPNGYGYNSIGYGAWQRALESRKIDEGEPLHVRHARLDDNVRHYYMPRIMRAPAWRECWGTP